MDVITTHPAGRPFAPLLFTPAHAYMPPCLQVQVPPALAASAMSQQEFDYDFERKVMSNDASTSFDAFLAKPEVRASCAM